MATEGAPTDTMATEGPPTDVVKVLHLLVLSFSWGMQLWVSFIAGFALVRQVSRHTFGLVQSKLFPVYFHCLLASSAVSLAVFAAYQPTLLLDWHQSLQMGLFFVLQMVCSSCCRWSVLCVTDGLFFMLQMVCSSCYRWSVLHVTDGLFFMLQMVCSSCYRWSVLHVIDGLFFML
ncbi:transmembrane protein 205 isoform X3 [Perca fluviatilis]|uniref:transmembrane protein 205 isoform X3 n=1 Tax=Perca fluviatilis TaxID=8168 RepID=UPI001964C8CE|nr:transmembrane protein 205 isoform X3 [Perca fluviatilis]